MKRFQPATAILFLIFLPFGSGFSQNLSDFGFTRSQQFPVTGLDFPWAGGMNACQFSEIDLNLDGKQDLFVFDRHGPMILTFLNNGNTSGNPYTFNPEYAAKFPPLTDWVRLADYNCDGKADIFTYGIGGIKVYRNVSDATNGLKFKLITNQLLSKQFNIYQGIYISNVDYPALKDMDSDGDLDLITFWIIGTYLHYHRNYSMEKFGHCDSLDFKLESNCWGYVKENEQTASLTMHAPCPAKCGVPFDSLSGKSDRHTGSTLLPLDLTGDGVMDMLIGDVDYPNLTALYNGGDPDSAHITSQDTTFPSASAQIVDIMAFPSADYVDVTNDQKPDLLVSPFDPNILTPENLNSVWLYQNTGNSSSPVFSFQKRNFLQEEMLDAGSASYPLIEDIDRDGLPDLILSSYGRYDSSFMFQNILKSSFTSRLTYYRNTGTQQNPVFTETDTNFADVYSLHLKGVIPAFGDPDQDGDRDLLLGHSDGSLIFLENTAGTGQFPVYAPPAYNYNGIDVGEFSAPIWVDLNSDMADDLVIGDKKGLLSYYRRNGSGYVLENDSLGKVDVRDPNLSYDGFSIPTFWKGYDDTWKLFVGSLKGGIHYFRNIEGHLQDTFSLVSDNYLGLKISSRSALSLGFLNGDTLPDLLMGTASGGVALFVGVQPGPAGTGDELAGEMPALWIFPNPANDALQVELNGAGHARFQGNITDLGGRVCLTFSMVENSRITLDVRTLAPGTYLLETFRIAGNKRGQRLVKRVVLSR